MAIATLSVDLVAKIAAFEKDLNRAAEASEAQSKRMASAFDFVGGAITGMVGALSIGAFEASLKSVADYGDELAKLSQKVGVSTEALSGLALAASYSDVSNEQLANGLKKLSQTMAGAAAGNEHLQKVLKAMGTTETKDVNKAFLEISDRFSELNDGAGKTALAMAGLGKGGADLIVLLNGGSSAIKEAAEQAQKFGLVLDEKSAKAMERFNDNLTEMEKRSQGLKVALLGGLIPVINQLYDDIKSFGTKSTLASAAGDVIRLKKEMDNLQSVKGGKYDLFGGVTRQIESVSKEYDAAKKKFNDLDVGRRSVGSTSSSALLKRQGSDGSKPKQDVDVSFLSTGGGGSSGAPKAKKEAIDATATALATYVTGLARAVEQTQVLTETEKALQFLRSQGAAGEVPQVRELVLGLTEQIDREKQLADVRKQSVAYFEGLAKEQVSLEEANQKLREQIEEIGLTKTELEALTLARLDSTIAQEQAILLMAKFSNASQEEIAVMEKKIKLLTEHRDLVGRGQIAQGLADTAAEQEKKSKEFADTLQGDVKSALSNAFRDSNDPLQAFGDALANIVFTRLSSSVADSLINATFGGGGGGGGFSLASLFSFDGGGYTGRGARSGGLDGKGGFLSIMHPQETVTDHTKGQSTASVVNHYNFTVGDVASKTMVMQAISNAQRQSAAAVNRTNRYA